MLRLSFARLKPSAAEVTALATIAVALGSVFTVLSETNQSRFALGVDLVLKLDDHFNSQKFRGVATDAPVIEFMT